MGIIFLLWLYNIEIFEKDDDKFTLLHADDVWLKYQKYGTNFNDWLELLDGYDWKRLFKNIDTIGYERQVDQVFYPELIQLGAISGFSKLTGKVNNIKSRESKINPDWDEDIILRLFDLFGQKLGWTPPQLPAIINRVDGQRHRIELSRVRDLGIKT